MRVHKAFWSEIALFPETMNTALGALSELDLPKVSSVQAQSTNCAIQTPRLSCDYSVVHSAVAFSPSSTLFSAHPSHFHRNALVDSHDAAPPPPLISSKTDEERDRSNQDTEPVPFSSTPDLGSPVSTTGSESGSQAVMTPPGDKFINLLNRKLKALANTEENNEGHSETCPVGCVQDEAVLKERSIDKPHPPDMTAYSNKRISIPSDFGWCPTPIPPVKAKQALKRKRDDPHSDCDVEVETDAESDSENRLNIGHTGVSVSKKLKETSFSYSVTETASSRRAHSLSACASFTSSSSPVTTEPASPVSSAVQTQSARPVPIIAPPGFISIPRPPLTPDDAAEARLRILLKKDRTYRHLDGFEEVFNPIFDKDLTQRSVDAFLGIDTAFRREVIQWMLRVTPSKKLRVAELRDQLRTSPETRFHAIMLFSHYFMRVGDAMPIATEKETPLMTLGRQRISWDVAVSCLALAVKFQRDFLSPLNPIYSHEFLVIAPHPMSHDDFEISQKDVLQALDYQIREVTPGPFMEEIWNSLPTFRKLLGFTEGWEVAQMNAWHRLNVASLAGEMFRFSMSLLSAAALIEGGIETLIALYESDMESQVGRELTDDEEVSLEDKATLAFAGVVEDIKDLIEITAEDMKRCRDWIQHIMQVNEDWTTT
ncbi:hypothetical protein M0805_000447 [Coniferiporia weirii]|nr:hypothetical protein M0805_000447 [Coniferiporia weirii]